MDAQERLHRAREGTGGGDKMDAEELSSLLKRPNSARELQLSTESTQTLQPLLSSPTTVDGTCRGPGAPGVGIAWAQHA